MTTVTLGTESEKPASSTAMLVGLLAAAIFFLMSTAGCWRSPAR